MCGSMVDIQSPTAEIRRGKKKKEETTGWQYNGLPYYMATITMYFTTVNHDWFSSSSPSEVQSQVKMRPVTRWWSTFSVPLFAAASSRLSSAPSLPSSSASLPVLGVSSPSAPSHTSSPHTDVYACYDHLRKTHKQPPHVNCFVFGWRWPAKWERSSLGSPPLHILLCIWVCFSHKRGQTGWGWPHAQDLCTTDPATEGHIYVRALV